MLVSTVCMRSETSAVESKSTIGLSITRLQASLIPAFFCLRDLEGIMRNCGEAWCVEFITTCASRDFLGTGITLR